MRFNGTTQSESIVSPFGNGVFVFKKINKIRWKPRYDSSCIAGQYFLTGSWDDLENEITLWQISETPNSEPIKIASIPTDGDVNDLHFLTSDSFVFSSSSGSVSYYKLLKDKTDFKMEFVLVSDWPKLHGPSASANSISSGNEMIVSGGSDGKLIFLHEKKKEIFRVFENADSVSLTAVKFIKHTEVLTANDRGQIKLWDLRSSNKNSSLSSLYSSSSNESFGISSLSQHPSQGHVLVSGSQSGLLSIWDLRNEQYPVTSLSAHTQSVSEVKFHDEQPDHIFSCSQGGELLNWDASGVTRAHSLQYGSQLTSSTRNNNNTNVFISGSPWLSSEAIKHKVEIRSLMSKQSLPINSLDVLGSSLLVGGDNEALYIFPSVIL